MLATEAAARAFTPGSHASTFGGTPLVTAAAAKVLELIARDAFLASVRDKGQYFLEKLEGLRARHPDKVRDVRGRGLMVGMELAGPGKAVVDGCLE